MGLAVVAVAWAVLVAIISKNAVTARAMQKK